MSGKNVPKSLAYFKCILHIEVMISIIRSPSEGDVALPERQKSGLPEHITEDEFSASSKCSSFTLKYENKHNVIMYAHCMSMHKSPIETCIHYIHMYL